MSDRLSCCLCKIEVMVDVAGWIKEYPNPVHRDGFKDTWGGVVEGETGMNKLPERILVNSRSGP